MSNMNEGERLAVIETLLQRLQADMTEIKADLKEIKDAAAADKAELQAIKNKGAGILIMVGLISGAIGAALKTFITSMWGH